MGNYIRKQHAGQVADRLPRKLSISFWYHNWVAEAQPGAPYDDLERCITEMKQRGFNTARVGVGLTYAFELDGRPRGPVAFEPPVPGHGSTAFAGFGGRRDVLERLIHLLDLARKHDVWIILTSWEYQDSACVGDPAVRVELASVPKPRRVHVLG